MTMSSTSTQEESVFFLFVVMLLCYYVIMLLWYYVIMVLCYYGIMVLWYYGIVLLMKEKNGRMFG
ncbi:hypothetical protein BDF14DRAFT_680842 [Spinellus fusiger]|nr:hypothetical protein BDF14DRAFT_680842 [Spinellus fusiger]